MMAKIALLGLGAMGGRMGQRLLDAGHELTFYNRTRDRGAPFVAQGAKFAETPKAAAIGAEVVISMLADNAASQRVWMEPKVGAIFGLGSKAIAIESSTLTVDWVMELSKNISHRNAAFIDAPVVGSRPQAQAGQLIYLLGGDEISIQAVHPILSVMGVNFHHVGPIGHGTALKLAVNGLFAAQVAAIAEVLSWLKKFDVSAEKAVRILSDLPVTSVAAKGAANLMVAKDFTPMFPIHLVEKDLRYLTEESIRAGIELPVAQAVRAAYRLAQDKGFGKDNVTGIIQLFSDLGRLPAKEELDDKHMNVSPKR